MRTLFVWLLNAASLSAIVGAAVGQNGTICKYPTLFGWLSAICAKVVLSSGITHHQLPGSCKSGQSGKAAVDICTDGYVGLYEIAHDIIGGLADGKDSLHTASVVDPAIIALNNSYVLLGEMAYA